MVGIAVLVGSTETMGVGTNVQARSIAIDDLVGAALIAERNVSDSPGKAMTRYRARR